ncbi:hypothetical protein IKQ26_06425 [bacterium]|nr:hypothetical protein [bacterium]
MNPIQRIIDQKVYAVVRVDNPERAVSISRALIKGGIDIIELMIENADLVSAVKTLKETEDVLLAAGGIITQRQADISIKAGADIIVSPIFQMNLVRSCRTQGVPLIMTATTPNEAYEEWKVRIPLIKIYPANAMGGAQYIEELLRPMKFLDVIATGNISLEGFTEYIDAGARAVGIGRAFYQYATEEEIVERAKYVLKKLEHYK